MVINSKLTISNHNLEGSTKYTLCLNTGVFVYLFHKVIKVRNFLPQQITSKTNLGCFEKPGPDIYSKINRYLK